MRRLSFAAHAIGHATFPALVVAYLLGWSIMATSLLTAVGVAVALGLLGRVGRLANGAAVGVVLSAALALGAVLVSDIADPGVGPDTLLFGSVLGIGWAQVLATCVVALPAVAVGAGLAGPLVAATFDDAAARATGTPTRLLETLLMATLGAVVAVGVPIAGSLMISGLLLIPAAAARLVVHAVRPLILASMALAATEGVVGLWLAVRLDAPPGACVALVGVCALIIATVATRAGRPGGGPIPHVS